MRTILFLRFYISHLPKWVYGRKWVLGLLTAMMIGAMLAKAKKNNEMVC